jgi:integrase
MHVNSWSLKDAKNLQEKELAKLFEAAKKMGPQIYLMIVLAYNAALRVSELIHAKVSDFHWETGRFSLIPLKKAGIRHKRDITGKVVTIDKPLPQPVDYPLPKSVMDLAWDYIQQQGLKKDMWVFPGNTTACKVVKLECPGGHVSKRQVQKLFTEMCKSVGIKLPGRGMHSLKHARLTEVAQKSKDPWLVREIGRHESVTMSNHYVTYTNLKEQVDKLGGRL